MNEIKLNLQDAIERGWLDKRYIKPIGHVCPEAVTYGQISPELYGRGVILELTIKNGKTRYWYLFNRFATNDRCLTRCMDYTDFEVRRGTWGEVWNADNAGEQDRQKFSTLRERYGELTSESPGTLIVKKIKMHGDGGSYYDIITYEFIADDWSKDAEPIRFSSSRIISD